MTEPLAKKRSPNPDKPEPKKLISRKVAKALSFSLPLFSFAALRLCVRHFLAQWAKILGIFRDLCSEDVALLGSIEQDARRQRRGMKPPG